MSRIAEIVTMTLRVIKNARIYIPFLRIAAKYNVVDILIKHDMRGVVTTIRFANGRNVTISTVNGTNVVWVQAWIGVKELVAVRTSRWRTPAETMRVVAQHCA